MRITKYSREKAERRERARARTHQSSAITINNIVKIRRKKKSFIKSELVAYYDAKALVILHATGGVRAHTKAK